MKLELHLAGKSLAAALVLATGGVLALASMAVSGGGTAPANTQAVVEQMITEKDHVQPTELAQWILEKRADYQLIDIREPWQFDDYHIPTAINIPLTDLFAEAGLARLERTKKIVVYGLGAGHPAQAQLLLTLKGYQALSLKEGITAWWDQVLTPQSLRGETANPTGYQQSKMLRERFMGDNSSPKSTSGATTAPPQIPPPSGGGTTAPKKLKLGRGCS
jgi:rhodanese-related sulfurtransferase